jgi:PAT family beta-lactamase induction signal transducer AmpG
MAALMLLGFASGLPLLMTSRTLQAWMTDAKVDLSTIGWFSLVGLPYTLKFLWSPLLDAIVPPFWGRRRGWLAITQLALVVAIAAMSLQNPQQTLQFLAINALIIVFISATQDIAGDAYRTDVLEPQELGAGASVWVLGYRLAVLVSGSLTLILADFLSWPTVYLLMAALMALGFLTTWWAPEPRKLGQPPDSLADAVVLPFQDFFQRLGITTAVLILVFILLYRVGDAFINNMATPFLLEVGYTKTDIGIVQSTTGFWATTLGVIGGGVVLTKLGIYRSLWIFGALQALSNLGYYLLSLSSKTNLGLLLAINVENLCAGLVTSAFVAYLMSHCNAAFTATQYALLSSLMAAAGIILASPAGLLAKAVGWPTFFVLSIVASLPGLLLLPVVAPWHGKPIIESEATLLQDTDSR